MPNSVEVPKEPAALSKLGEISHKKLHKTDHLDKCNSEKDFETDFLISPGDVYPNRKVKLEDADISEGTGEGLKRCVTAIRMLSPKTTKT